MGRISWDVGDDFEARIETKLQTHVQQLLVSRYQKNGPRFARGRHVAASGADFSGMLSGGLHFALEAKSNGMDKRAGRLSEFVLEKRIPETQLADLEATAQGGGLSLLALEFRPEDGPWETFVLPWRRVPWRTRKVSHSVCADDLRAGGWLLPKSATLLESFIQPGPASVMWIPRP